MNKETAITQAQLNMVDQAGPQGSSTYSQIGTYDDGTPKFQQSVTLSPEQQAIYDSQNRISQQALDLGQGAIGNVSNAISKPFDTSGVPGQVFGVNGGPVQTGVGDYGSYQTSIPGQQFQRSIKGSEDYGANVAKVEAALMSRLDPKIAQDRNRVETRLANQGVTQGTKAWDDAVRLSEQNINDARMQAVLAAGGEQSRLAGLDLAAGNFANDATGKQFATDAARAQFGNDVTRQRLTDALSQADLYNAGQSQAFGQGVTNANLQNAGRGSAIQEQAYLRSQPINELAALMGFSPGVQVPNFQNTASTGIAPPDYQGAVGLNYQGQLNNYNQKMQANSALMGDIFGLAGAAAPFALSDRRMKADIRRIGTASNGLPIYSYRYKSGGPVQIGFMADEVERVKPWAVLTRSDGYKMVNYSLAAA